MRGSKHQWLALKVLKRKRIQKRGGVNHVWWCQKGGEIKEKATHQKQNYKLWEINEWIGEFKEQYQK